MIVLDTDHCVAILRGRLKPAEQVSDVVAITTVTLGELAHGAHRSAKASDNMTALDSFVALFTVLPFDEASARVFGQVKAELQSKDSLIEDLDLQIASIALRNGATLVTHNTRHFRRISGLALDDWLSAQA